MPDQSGPDGLLLQPLPADALSPAVARVLAGPSVAKLMVAKGMAPLRPAELMTAIYQLSFDPDGSVRAAAEAAPAALPDNILGPPLAEACPAQVLHFFATHLPDQRTGPIEKILYNPATADETFLALAGRLDESLLEVISQNEVRLLRCPRIVEALFFNKRARMSSVNRAVELCARNGIRLETIPGFDEIAKAIQQDSEAASPEATDDRFQAALSASEGAAAGQEVEPGANSPAEQGSETKKRPLGLSFIKFDQLKIFEKVRLATVGNATCRKTLVRDANRLVAMAVIRSPQITDMEIQAFAGSTNVCDDVIRYIANNRECSKDYKVKLALVGNPKCPVGLSLRFLSYLHQDDLRNVSRSKNIPGALATAAKKLLQQREGGRK